MISEDALKDLIVEAFPDADLVLEDLTGTQDHWKARIVSATFEGLALVRRHRLVYAALGEAMAGPIHAFALDTLTPAEADEA